MKNLPKKIYLQSEEAVDDFKELSEVTWCDERINENDIEYVLPNAPVSEHGISDQRIEEITLNIFPDIEDASHEEDIQNSKHRCAFMLGVEAAIKELNLVYGEKKGGEG